MIWLVLSLIFLIPLPSQAADWNATTCSYADVNAAVVSASDGDRVVVPTGFCIWATLLTPGNKAISLVGAGIGLTNIAFASANGGINWVTKSTGNSPAGFTEITGFTFTTTAGAGCSALDGISSSIKIRGTSANVRIHHNSSVLSTCATYHIHGYVRGVFDHNELYNQVAGAHPLIIEHPSWGGVGSEGDNSWAQNPTIGTADTFVVEDNVFTNDIANGFNLNGVYMTDDHMGSRTVYRFNTLNNGVLSNHGTESGGRKRGFRHMEVYRNAFNYPTSVQIESMLGLRGGTGLLFDNYMPQNRANQFFAANTFRRYFNVTGVGYYVWGGCGRQTSITSITRSGTTATATTTSEHFIHPSGSWVTISGGTSPFNGTFIATRVNSTQFTYTVANSGDTTSGGTPFKTSPFDGNTDSTGYPCLDQLGRGKGQLYSGYEPNIITPVAPANQDLEPVYVWNNLKAGVISGIVPQGTTDIFQANREYYNHNAFYNGTTERGVGYGTRASRPATCTTGDAWWSTDQGSWNTSTTETYSANVGLSSGADGVLDKCTSTNTWTNNWYVPLTYPHPLVTGGGGGGGGGGTITKLQISGSVSVSGSVKMP